MWLHFVIPCSVLTLTWSILVAATAPHSPPGKGPVLLLVLPVSLCSGGVLTVHPLSPSPPVRAQPSLTSQRGESADHPGLHRPRSMLHVAVGFHPRPSAPPSPGYTRLPIPLLIDHGSCCPSFALYHPAWAATAPRSPLLSHFASVFFLTVVGAWPLWPRHFLTLIPAVDLLSPPTAPGHFLCMCSPSGAVPALTRLSPSLT